MKNMAELAQWREAAEEEFGDPSTPICQLFFRWTRSLLEHNGDELVCGRLGDTIHLLFAEGLPLPFHIVNGRQGAYAAGGYRAQRITKGVFQISPSLNIPGIIHGFVVLYDVPEPAPWEVMVIL
jgi:hypothetical protein